jgi:hypothetical protein
MSAPSGVSDASSATSGVFTAVAVDKHAPHAPAYSKRLHGGLTVAQTTTREVFEYDFSSALFENAFSFFFVSGLVTRQFVAFLGAIVLVTLVAATAACNARGVSVLMGSTCWRNDSPQTWGDMTLLFLTSFLLGLLVNNVLTRWWTTRVQAQDVINTMVQIYFHLRTVLVPKAGRTAEQLAAREAALVTIKRRLRLAFRIMLIAAKTNDTDGATAVVTQALENLMRPTAHRSALMLPCESKLLGGHRHAYSVIGWVLRDLSDLHKAGDFMDAFQMGTFHAHGAKLRALCEDLPLFVRVQLPFVTVSVVACVVHLAILQIMYVSASVIGAGINDRGGTAVLSGVFSVSLLPAVFLSILKMQALLSNPFGKDATARTNFPVAQLKYQLDAMLVSIDRTLGEEALATIGAETCAAEAAAAEAGLA